MTADDKKKASNASFNDIIAFVVGEINVRVYQILAGELSDFDLMDETVQATEKLERPRPMPISQHRSALFRKIHPLTSSDLEEVRGHT